MKRIIFLLGGIFLSLLTYAQTIKYIGCTPADNSSIDEFSFTLTFDINDAVESLGSGEWGLGYSGNSTTQYTTLFEGTKEDGSELAKIMTSNMTGKSDEFEVNGNRIKLSFPSSIVPKENQRYTLVIQNNFVLFEKGKQVPKSTTYLKFADNPLVLTFTGKKTGDDKLMVENISVDDNATLETLKNVEYTFNVPIVVNSGVAALIKDNDTVIAQANSMTVVDNNTLVVDFVNDVNLNLGHTYSVILPAGAVSMGSDTSKTNNEFSFSVNGSKTYTYDVKSISPVNGEKCLPTQISIVYDIPEQTNITGSKNQATNKSLKIYKSEVSEANLLSELLGTYNSNNTGLDWDVSKIPFEPSTEYIIVREQGLGYLFNKDNVRLPEWTNGGVESSFTTISVAESGVPKVEFQAPVLGKYNANGNNVTLNNGDKISEISTIDFLFKDLRYSYNGEYVGATLTDTGSGSIEIYDITNGEPILIKSATLSKQQYEATTYYYSVYRAIVNLSFFEGHTYKVVLPAGIFGAAPSSIRNFSLNDELSVEFEGSAPSSVDLISCSLADNAELSELYGIVWKFKGEFVRNPDKNVRLFHGNVVSTYIPTFVSVFNGETTIMAFASNSDGTPETLKDGTQYRAILPEGIIYYAGDPTIKNSEYTIPFTGVAKTPEVIKPEYVNLTIDINGITTIEQQAVKGEKATITLAPTEDWKVESIDGASQSGVNSYSTPVLTADASIKVELAYDGSWAKEVSTNVYEIEEDNIRIYKDGDHIIVEGAKPDQIIYVYNIAGLLVNSANSEEGKDKVILTISQNQEYYIVTVAGKAAKIKM